MKITYFLIKLVFNLTYQYEKYDINWTYFITV